MVVQTSSRAAHQDPSTVILMGAACAGICRGTTSPVYVTSLTFVGSQRALHINERSSRPYVVIAALEEQLNAE